MAVPPKTRRPGHHSFPGLTDPIYLGKCPDCGTPINRWPWGEACYHKPECPRSEEAAGPPSDEATA